MFRSLICFAVLLVADVCLAQCNSGQSTQAAQVSANQQLVLQQTAALAAAQQAQQNRQAASVRQVTSVAQPLATAAPPCLLCNQAAGLVMAPGQVPRPIAAAAPPATSPKPAPPAFVRITGPATSAPRAEGTARYVLMSAKGSPPALTLASR